MAEPSPSAGSHAVPSPATAIATALRRNGSEVAFGMPGGGPNLDLVGALEAEGIRFVLAHGETAACIMASVHGHLTGRPSAAVVTRGPGAASAVNGAAQATLDRQPLVVITDTVPASSAARVPHQRIDQRALFAPVTKRSVTVGAGADVERLTDLIATAGQAPAGAIHLDDDRSTTGIGEPPPSDRPAPTSPATQAARTEIAGLISGARRPLVLAGLGAVAREPAAQRRLVAALERFDAPVLTTYQATGTIPADHRLAGGLFTNGASERSLIDRADLVVALGLDVVEPIPAAWAYQAPVVSLAASQTLDPYLPLTAELVGDPVGLAASLLVAGERDWEPGAAAAHRDAVLAELRAGAAGNGFGPIELVDAVVSAAPLGVTTTVDAGAHFLAVMPFWPVRRPNELLISNGLATMGFALPAAIAAALARTGDPVLCLVGDGGLGMTMAELETVARLELPITVVVFNDRALSLIRVKQQAGHGGADAVTYRPSDFAAVARGLGLDATTATGETELAGALASGWERPRLIDAHIDPEAYRHLIKITRG